MLFLVNQLVIQLTMRAMELICSLFFSLFRGNGQCMHSEVSADDGDG